MLLLQTHFRIRASDLLMLNRDFLVILITAIYIAITKQNKRGSTMGSFYSCDYFVEDHILTDITCNIEEPQQREPPWKSFCERFPICTLHNQ